MGVQIVARKFEEEKVLAIARIVYDAVAAFQGRTQAQPSAGTV